MDDNRFRKLLEKIAASPELISNTIQSGNEFYFDFMGNQFSVAEIDDAESYEFYIYPPTSNFPGRTVRSLVDVMERGAPGVSVPMFKLESSGLTLPALKNLYRTVAIKHLHIDDMMRNILGSDY